MSSALVKKIGGRYPCHFLADHSPRFAMLTKHQKFMGATEAIALLFSKDRSTQVAALIVDERGSVKGLGYNGFVRGADDEKPERHVRPGKYLYAEHAERNAFYNREGPVHGCRIYVSGLPPCAECARAIVQNGVTEVVLRHWDIGQIPDRWRENMAVSREILDEARVRITTIGGVPPLSWSPELLSTLGPFEREELLRVGPWREHQA